MSRKPARAKMKCDLESQDFSEFLRLLEILEVLDDLEFLVATFMITKEKKAAAKVSRLFSFVANASPAAMPKMSAQVPGFHLLPGSR